MAKRGIHNKATYQLFYEKYSMAFIDNYIFARNQDYERNEAFHVARIRLQDMVIQDMFTNRPQMMMIIKAYSDIKDDHDLYRLAIEKFNETN
ncbi:MAG: hypothetical protein ACJ704_08570 [Nitrososphaeraceae archaeon]